MRPSESARPAGSAIVREADATMWTSPTSTTPSPMRVRVRERRC